MKVVLYFGYIFGLNQKGIYPDSGHNYPYFGQSVKNLSGVEVSLTGYILALDPDEGYYILSKGPFASCFFCGDGGPETIVELELKNKNQYFMMDEIATIKGVLKLNADDIYQCVYILQNAEVSR